MLRYPPLWRARVAPLVFPGAFGPGRCMCPWAAARPLAVRAASLRLGASARSPARPCRRPQAPQPPACCMVTTKHAHASSPPSGTAASRRRKDRHTPHPAAAYGHRGHALRRPPHRQRCVVVCGGQALPPPTDTAAIPPGPAAPSTLRTHVVSCVAAPGGRILIRTVGIVLREVSGKASPGPLQAFWSRGGYESMSGCDRASQAHTEAPGAVAPGALAAIRCELSEPNATRSVAA